MQLPIGGSPDRDVGRGLKLLCEPFRRIESDGSPDRDVGRGLKLYLGVADHPRRDTGSPDRDVGRGLKQVFGNLIAQHAEVRPTEMMSGAD